MFKVIMVVMAFFLISCQNLQDVEPLNPKDSGGGTHDVVDLSKDFESDVSLGVGYVDMKVSGLGGFLAGFKSKCAKGYNYREINPENSPYVRPDVVDVNLSWYKNIFCNGMLVNQYDVEDSMVLGDGGLEVLVYQSFYDEDFQSIYLGEGAKYLALLNKQNGEGVRCLDSFGNYRSNLNDGSVSLHNRLVKTKAGKTLYLGRTIEVLQYPREDYPVYLHWWSFSWDKKWTQVRLEHPEEWGFLASELMPDGQLIASISPGHIISIDSESGDLNWVVQSKDIAVNSQPVSANTPPINVLFARWDYEKRRLYFHIKTKTHTNGEMEYTELYIDHCGALGLEGTTIKPSNMFALGTNGHKLLIEPKLDKPTFLMNVVDGNNESVFSQDDCLDLITLEDEEIACVMYGSSQDLSIRIFNKNGLVRTFHHTLSDELKGLLVKHNKRISVLSGGVLLYELVIYRKNNNGIIQISETRLNFVDVKSLEKLNEFIIKRPSYIAEDVPFVAANPPVFDDNGQIYLNRFGSVFAIQTNLKGLAKTSFPKGLRYSVGNRKNWLFRNK